MTKNDVLTLSVTGMTLQGAGLARAEGLLVFLPGACPGDTVRAVIVKTKGNCAFGKCLEVLEPSPARIPSACQAFPRCGGCAFRHITYEAELALKQREVGEILRRIGGLTPELRPILGAERPDRYRNKAMVPLGWDGGRVAAGFFAPHSHRIVPLPDATPPECAGGPGRLDCRLAPVSFGGLLAAVVRWAERRRVSVYDETAHRGLLRTVGLRSAAGAGGDILLTLVINGESIPQPDELTAALRAACPTLRGVVLNSNRARTNVLLGPLCVPLWGEETLTDVLCGLEFSVSPLSFYQVNPAQAARLYALAGDYAGLTGAERVLDLCCGTGTIGLTLARRAAEVVGIEVVPAAAADAAENARRGGISNARFLCADAAEGMASLAAEGFRPDVIVVDPPRKGCAPALLDLMAEAAPRRIVYISCNPATLARDLAILAKKGYAAREVTPVDMFPRTAHAECAALLERL
ncbi:MAG: 23S rRNA (uracil(1939)-C(5))-methyltransferase RlmD [Oscillospiraceae bacterium]|jgi:23S rRNA (uracil1939-C5)-methyltransferase|nr:23S rRNA (uracil(1939)-C(5))-methyltransferase RlmD [Oscillospiraceae bacterium]